jgi:hypothetical protein
MILSVGLSSILRFTMARKPVLAIENFKDWKTYRQNYMSTHIMKIQLTDIVHKKLIVFCLIAPALRP